MTSLDELIRRAQLATGSPFVNALGDALEELTEKHAELAEKAEQLAEENRTLREALVLVGSERLKERA